MKTVITYGTFDLFHYGHYNLLKRASELGDYLIVGVSSDEMCVSKGKVTFLPLEKRLEIVSNLRFVWLTMVENDMGQKVADVVQYKADVFVLGDDYKDIFPKMKEYKAIIEAGCEVVFLPRTKDVSTTDLKRKIVEQERLNLDSFSIHNMTKNS